MEHPVFGPNRPLAAVRAITELQAARSALPDWDRPSTPAAYERYRTAMRVRAMYSEYADDFRGH